MPITGVCVAKTSWSNLEVGSVAACVHSNACLCVCSHILLNLGSLGALNLDHSGASQSLVRPNCFLLIPIDLHPSLVSL